MKRGTWAALGLLALAGESHATLVDLRNEGSGGGGYGNSLSFSEEGIGLTVTAYGATGTEVPPASGYREFRTAEIYSWSTGLGSCNRSEGTIASGGCNDAEHEVDTVGFDDLVAFVFDTVVDFEFLTVDPFNSAGNDPNDRDIIYWVGTAASLPDLSAETFFTLASLVGFGPEVQSSASSSYSPYTHALTGTGNILLLAGDYHDMRCRTTDISSDTECEAYKIANIVVSAVAPVPLPAPALLLGSALAGLGVLRRRFA